MRNVENDLKVKDEAAEPIAVFVANGLNFNVNCASKAGPIPAMLELIVIIFPVCGNFIGRQAP